MANIPPTVVVPQGGRRPDLLRQILGQVLGTAAQLGTQRGLEALNVIDTPDERAGKVAAAQRGEVRKTAEFRAQQEAQALAAAEAARRGSFEQALASMEGVTPEQGSLLRALFEFENAGMDATSVRQALAPNMPVTEQELLEQRKARLDISLAENTQQADEIATQELIRTGMLPPEMQAVPGAAKTLLAVREAQEGKPIDWQQEGIDFVTGLLRQEMDPLARMIAEQQGVDTSGGRAVSVEEAVGIWREVVSRTAPADQRDEIIANIDSNFADLAAEQATVETAISMGVQSILEGGGDIAAVRAASAEAGFTPAMVKRIVQEVRKRTVAARKEGG